MNRRFNPLSLDALNFLLADVRGALGPFLNVFLVAQQHWSQTQVGIVTTTSGLLGLALQTPIGAAIDATRAKRGAIILALAVLAVGAIIIFTLPTFWPVLLANSMIAVVGDVFGPAVAALTLGLYARNQLARRMGRNSAYDHAGNVGIAIVAGAVGYVFSQRAVFLLVPIFAVLSTATVLSIPADTIDYDRARDVGEKSGEQNISGYSVLFKTRPLIIFGVCHAFSLCECTAFATGRSKTCGGISRNRDRHDVKLHCRRATCYAADGSARNPAAYASFLRRLSELGWTDGRNVRIEVRWANSDPELMRSYGTELAGHSPDVFLVQSNPALAVLRPLAGNTPIVFVHVADPVGSGFVASLARPGANITGFTNFEPSMGSKWLQTLKQVAPDVTHAAALLHPQTPAHVAFWREAEAAAPKMGINPVAAGVHDAGEVDRAIAAVAAQPNGGLVIYPHTITEVHLRLIIELAGKYRLPAVYPFRYHAEAGGLLSYGVDALDLVPRAADYVDRIMRGANPGELPVQAPTKFELVINLKTAKALGLDVPTTLLTRADQVIE